MSAFDGNLQPASRLGIDEALHASAAFSNEAWFGAREQNPPRQKEPEKQAEIKKSGEAEPSRDEPVIEQSTFSEANNYNNFIKDPAQVIFELEAKLLLAVNHFGATSGTVAQLYDRLGDQHAGMGNLKQSRESFEQAAQIWAGNPNHSFALALTLMSLADAYTAEGNSVAAGVTKSRAAHLAEKTFTLTVLSSTLSAGGTAERISEQLTYLAQSYHQEGTLESKAQARRMHELAIHVLRQEFGDEDPKLRIALERYRTFLQIEREIVTFVDLDLKKLKPDLPAQAAASKDSMPVTDARVDSASVRNNAESIGPEVEPGNEIEAKPVQIEGNKAIEAKPVEGAGGKEGEAKPVEVERGKEHEAKPLEVEGSSTLSADSQASATSHGESSEEPHFPIDRLEKNLRLARLIFSDELPTAVLASVQIGRHHASKPGGEEVALAFYADLITNVDKLVELDPMLASSLLLEYSSLLRACGQDANAKSIEERSLWIGQNGYAEGVMKQLVLSAESSALVLPFIEFAKNADVNAQIFETNGDADKAAAERIIAQKRFLQAISIANSLSLDHNPLRVQAYNAYIEFLSSMLKNETSDSARERLNTEISMLKEISSDFAGKLPDK